MMRTALLWVFGLIPAAIWFAWSFLYALLSALAIFSSPGQSLLYTPIAALSAYGAVSVVFVVLGRTQAYLRHGLFVALAFLIPAFLFGVFSEPTQVESLIVVIVFCLIVVTTLLLRDQFRGAISHDDNGSLDNA